MRHLSSPHRVALALASLVALGPAAAAADPAAAEAQCTGAYTDTQKLRADGRYQAAREKALLCSQETCAAWVKADCLKWASELDAAMPTLVLEVHDTAGAETSEVRVSIDGKPWLQRVDGRAVAADPGPHTLVFEIDGAPPIEQRLVVRELEKGRKVAVSFEKKAPSSPALPPPAPSGFEAPAVTQSPGDEEHGAPAWAWALGATGVVAIGVATPLIIVAAGNASEASEICPPPSCAAKPNAEAASLNSNAMTFGAVGGVVGGLGLVALAVGIYGIVSAPPTRESSVSFRVAPGAVELEASF